MIRMTTVCFTAFTRHTVPKSRNSKIRKSSTANHVYINLQTVTVTLGELQWPEFCLQKYS